MLGREIVAKAKRSDRAIAIEDFTGIRRRVQAGLSWAFSQSRYCDKSKSQEGFSPHADTNAAMNLREPADRSVWHSFRRLSAAAASPLYPSTSVGRHEAISIQQWRFLPEHSRD